MLKKLECFGRTALFTHNIKLSCAADPDCEANPDSLHPLEPPDLQGVSFNAMLGGFPPSAPPPRAASHPSARPLLPYRPSSPLLPLSPLFPGRLQGAPFLTTSPGERRTPNPCDRPSPCSPSSTPRCPPASRPFSFPPPAPPLPPPLRPPSVCSPPRLLPLAAGPLHLTVGRGCSPAPPTPYCPPCSRLFYSSVPPTTSSASVSTSPASPSSPYRLPLPVHLQDSSGGPDSANSRVRGVWALQVRRAVAQAVRYISYPQNPERTRMRLEAHSELSVETKPTNIELSCAAEPDLAKPPDRSTSEGSPQHNQR